MGRTFQFDCPLCQYRVRVSGGTDDGVHCSVQTIVCLDCRELFDVCTRVRRLAEHVGAARRTTGFLPERTIPPPFLREAARQEFAATPGAPRPARPFIWETFKLACPASPRHRIEVWKDPGRCPRCGSYLEKNGFPFRRWE